MVDEGFFGIETQYPSLQWEECSESVFEESIHRHSGKCLRSQNFLISKATYASRREKFWPDPDRYVFFLLFWCWCLKSRQICSKNLWRSKKRISFESAQHQIDSSRSCRSSGSKKLLFQIFKPRSYRAWSRAARWDISSLNAALEKLEKKTFRLAMILRWKKDI